MCCVRSELWDRYLSTHAAHLVPTHGMHEKRRGGPCVRHSTPQNVKLTVGNVTAHLVLGHDQVLGDRLLLLLVVGHRCTGSGSGSMCVYTVNGQQKSVTLPPGGSPTVPLRPRPPRTAWPRPLRSRVRGIVIFYGAKTDTGFYILSKKAVYYFIFVFFFIMN